MDTLVKIGDAAVSAGLPEKTIRYYEDIGLVSPLRSENGFRQFRQSDVRALRLVKNARNLGFSLGDCRSLLELYKNQSRTSAEVKALTSHQLAETRERLAQLERLCTQLEQLTAECKGNEDPRCPILNFLAEYE